MQLRFQFLDAGKGNLVFGQSGRWPDSTVEPPACPAANRPAGSLPAESAELTHIQSNGNPGCVSLRFNR
jgi:hypothetical protein